MVLYCELYKGPACGLTNQLISLTNTIIKASLNNDKIVCIKDFKNCINNNNKSNISDIINLEKTNDFLKKYNIKLIDFNKNFELLNVKYGNNSKYIDLTDYFQNLSNKNNNLIISKGTILNDIKGDPCFGVSKTLTIKYKLNNNIITDTFKEDIGILTKDIIINVHKFDFLGPRFNYYPINICNDIITNIYFKNEFIENSKSIIKNLYLSNLKINVIHLRLENDALKHWSRMNKMSINKFKNILELKYIEIVKKFISTTDLNILLTSSIDNASNFINYMNTNNYKYIFSKKFYNEREKNAIVDLLLSNYCNNIFVNNFNFKNLNGSTFSYLIGTNLKNVKKISIDLDNINKDYLIS
jgi:hypothetical protein